jgi:hypothetical protein
MTKPSPGSDNKSTDTAPRGKPTPKAQQPRKITVTLTFTVSTTVIELPPVRYPII